MGHKKLVALLSFALVGLLIGCSSRSPQEESGLTQTEPGEVTTLTEVPEEGLSQTPWVKERIKTLVDLYDITPAGQEWLEGYDLRQMVGKPGWFGSLGYDKWAGVGQAIPGSILHEISHSYYGAFPVSGRPELTWKRKPADSPAMEQYHRDWITFMFQPPDPFEPLRDRFRNLPNLSRDPPDLFHFGEADLFYTAGGNLNLIPPVFRKYFSQFLQEGEFPSWEEAVSWYLGLSPDEKKAAEGYIGITHLPLQRYRDLKPSESTHVPERVMALLEKEGKQRLIDFAQQFDLIKAHEFSLVDAAGVDRSFQFWRDYLISMLKLHKNHPHILAETGGKGFQLKKALDIFIEAEKLSENERVTFFDEKLKDPFLRNFSVLLPRQVIIELFSRSPEELPLQSVEGVVAVFNQKLSHYAKEVDAVLSAGLMDLAVGSEKLEKFLQGLGDDRQEKDLALIFDLMRDADRITAKHLINRLSDGLILSMLKNKPSAVRGDNVSPERLLQALGVTHQHSPAEIVRGIKTLLEETSGNFKIDEPSTKLAYRVIVDVAKRDFRLGLAILRDSGVSLVGFISAFPEESVRIFSSDLSEAAKLIARPQGYARSSPGIIHRLIPVDPELAANLVSRLDSKDPSVVAEALIHFAYDSHRKATQPSLPISPEKDGLFLLALADLRGDQWVVEHMGKAIATYQGFVEEAIVPQDFLQAYRDTLAEAENQLSGPEVGARLCILSQKAFSQAGESY